MIHSFPAYRAAILLHTTDFSLPVICAYLNAQNDYWHNEPSPKPTYVQYITERAQITRLQMKKLERASAKMFQHGKYSLAEEYAMLNNVLRAMEDWEGFTEANKELYQNAVNELETLQNQILNECLTTMKNQCADLIQDNQIREENKENAIHRYMAANHYDAA